MRLVQLAHYGGPYAGSFIPMLRSVLLAARASGYDVLAIFSEVARDRAWLRDFDADDLPYRFAAAGSAGALERILGRPGAGEPAILHSHFTGFDFAAARFARHDPRSAAVWHVHSAHGAGALAFARNVARYTALARGVAEFLCVSPALERDVRRRLANPRRVHFFPNAIDTTRFAPAAPAARAAQRERLGLAADDFVLLHFGHDWANKGGEVFFAAAARLVAGGRHVTVLTVGGGEIARRRARELAIESHVRVLEPSETVEQFYAVADVLVMPSLREGMPFAMAEALASGTAVVATDASGQRYLGEGLAAVRLVPPAVDPVTAAVASLLDRSPSAVAEEAGEARASMLHRMSLDHWSERLLRRYEALGGGHRFATARVQ